MRLLYALGLTVVLTSCADEPPPPPAPQEVRVLPDTAAGGVPGPTADEIEAGADMIDDALGGATGL